MEPDYTMLEQEIEKYRRRLRRIEENPDPTRMRSNKFLYQLELQERIDWLEGWKSGKPFAYSYILEELLEAMGFLCIPITLTGDRLANQGTKYLTKARQLGYPSDICDRFQMVMGMVLSGELPPPNFIVGGNVACCVGIQMVVAIGSHFENVPTYSMDRYMEPDGEPYEYFLEQLHQIIDLAECSVPGIRFDSDKLLEAQEKERQAQVYLNDLYSTAKQVPCPIRGQDMFRIVEPRLASRPGGLEYFKMVHDETMERAAKGVAAIGEEKARAMWCVTAPFFDDAMSLLEARGVAVPVYQMDGLSRLYGYGEGLIRLPGEDGMTLSPLEEFARYTMLNVWGGPAKKWVDDLIGHCREFKIDMVVYYMPPGCPANVLSAKIVADRVQQELGLPTLLLDGSLIDPEKYDHKKVEARIDEFVNIALQLKAARA